VPLRLRDYDGIMRQHLIILLSGDVAVFLIDDSVKVDE
jgi:hypothetical protein